MEVVVEPRFYQTIWFKLVLLLTCVGVFSGIQELRIRRLQEVQRLRSQIANDLHDEIGSNLGGMVLLADRAGRTAQSEGGKEWKRVSQLAQQAAQSMREIVWFINPEFDTLTEMVARMRDTAAQALAGVSWHFQAPDRLPPLKLKLEKRRNIFLIYKEALHNIAKHSGATAVTISLAISKDCLTLHVADNGQGFPVSGQPQDKMGRGFGGNGLRSMRKRAEAAEGTIDWVSTPGKGLVVELVVPV